jgi:hypothetical protein
VAAKDICDPAIAEFAAAIAEIFRLPATCVANSSISDADGCHEPPAIALQWDPTECPGLYMERLQSGCPDQPTHTDRDHQEHHTTRKQACIRWEFVRRQFYPLSEDTTDNGYCSPSSPRPPNTDEDLEPMDSPRPLPSDLPECDDHEGRSPTHHPINNTGDLPTVHMRDPNTHSGEDPQHTETHDEQDSADEDNELQRLLLYVTTKTDNGWETRV